MVWYLCDSHWIEANGSEAVHTIVTNMLIVIIGGGPAGLMAAEAALSRGAKVELFDAMPSIGRKLLLAGKGGLNLTHAEPLDAFMARYGPHRNKMAPFLKMFGPEALRDWAKGLGIETFVGSSGRIFPLDMKAAPLLRAWLRRLRRAGLIVQVRHRWDGWQDGGLRFVTPEGVRRVHADATVLALGGGSWPKTGSSGAWVEFLRGRGVRVAALKPANCGFDVGWSEHFRSKYAGHPVKTVGVVAKGLDGEVIHRQGEFVVTETGVEGGVIYQVAACLRDVIDAKGKATLRLDLAPDRELPRLIADLSQPRGKRTVATQLKRRARVEGVKAGLLREVLSKDTFTDPKRLAPAIKSLPLTLVASRPLEEAISSAGGVTFESLDEHLMIRSLPGVFCAGEMLDWEAPTGGYLLTACFATGRAAGAAAVEWVTRGGPRGA
jgi:uncharacterized flavoprotein (TIGR03862 family)